MIRTPTQAEIAKLNAQVAEVDGKEQENAAFFGLYNRENGLVYRQYGKRRKPLRTREMIERFVRIRDQDGKIVPLMPNTPQRIAEAAILRQERANLPVRIIILKARKVGMCLDPDTRVLTSDLRWVKIDSVRAGDSLVGVDEESRGGKGPGRRLRGATVEAKREIVSESLRITMDSGEIIATPEHRFLVRRGSTQVWRMAGRLRVGDQLRHVVSPWGESTFDDGWFGGMIDGEGHLRPHNRPGVELNVSQNQGVVLDRAVKYLADHGYTVNRASRVRPTAVADKLQLFRIDEVMRLIGTTRPIKHVGREWWSGKELPGKRSGCEFGYIKSIERSGVRRMIDLQTSTKTFIAEGIVSHNSTWIVARGYARSLVDSHVKIGVLAHTDDTATEVLKMAHIMRDNVPKADGRAWKFAFNHQATYHIAFKGPMFGEMMIASAQHTGGSEPFRGFTPTYLHMSEASRYPNAEATAQSALVAVPKRPGTAVFIESTANGDHGDFKERFWSAYEEKELAPSQMRQSWVAIFVPWFWREDCRWTQTVGHGRKLPDDLIIEIQQTLTEHERWLLTQRWFRRGRPGMEWEEVPCLQDKPYTDDHHTPGFKWRLRDAGWRNVDYDQLAWRRWTIKDEFNANPLDPQTWSLFQEEFPSTPTEAFRSTGALVFNAGEIYDQLQRVKPASFRGELVDTSAPSVAKIEHKNFDPMRRTIRPRAMSGE